MGGREALTEGEGGDSEQVEMKFWRHHDDFF